MEKKELNMNQLLPLAEHQGSVVFRAVKVVIRRSKLDRPFPIKQIPLKKGK